MAEQKGSPSIKLDRLVSPLIKRRYMDGYITAEALEIPTGQVSREIE